MKAKELFVRCYIEKKNDLWIGVCVDFCLGVQADSPEEAKKKLEGQISDYLNDIVHGDDREFAEQLLFRKAPLEFRLKYNFFVLLQKIHAFKERIMAFKEIMPVTLGNIKTA